MRFSDRLPWELHPNRLTELLRSVRGRQERVLDLTASNPTTAGFRYPDELVATLHDRRALKYEPDPFGLPSVRESIAGLYGASPDAVAVTASTSEAYSWLFKLLCNPGDNILVPRPSYPLFEYLAALENVQVDRYSLFYDRGWFIDFHTLERALTARTKAVVVVNPNNPTGNFIRRHEAEQLQRMCAGRQIAIISDEVFQDYAIHPTPDSVLSLAGSTEALTFCLNGLSKSLGLPQMKLAWMLWSGAPALVEEARARLEIIADTFLSAGTPIQVALPKLLMLRPAIQEQIRERIKRNLDKLGTTELRVLRTEAGWNAIVMLPGFHTEDEWIEQLLVKEGVLVQPGYFYDFERAGYAVLSLLTPPDIFDEGLSQIVKSLR